MTLLLYFTSFASVLTLIVTAVVVCGFVFIRVTRAANRLYLSMTDPEGEAERKASRRPVQQLHHLKRAGQ